MTYFSEKQGGTERTLAWMAGFQEAIDFCELLDLGFKGPVFIWNNRRTAERNIQEHLDRFQVSRAWQAMYSSSQVTHLDYWGSDHRAFLLELAPQFKSKRMRDKRGVKFRFKPWWLKDEECMEAITNCWQSHFFDGSTAALTIGLS